MGLLTKISDLFRPVLSDRSIKQYNRQGLLIKGDLTTTQIQPNSIDLTLSNSWAKPLPNDMFNGTPIINTRKPITYEEGKFQFIQIGEDEFARECYIMQPGEFVLMASKEILKIPNGILTFVQGRSSIARIGIQTEQAGLIDAGFEGTITFEVYNETEYPITLFSGMRVGQLYFFKAEKASMAYGDRDKGSKYQQQFYATGSKINQDPELRQERL